MNSLSLVAQCCNGSLSTIPKGEGACYQGVTLSKLLESVYWKYGIFWEISIHIPLRAMLTLYHLLS